MAVHKPLSLLRDILQVADLLGLNIKSCRELYLGQILVLLTSLRLLLEVLTVSRKTLDCHIHALLRHIHTPVVVHGT